MITCFFLYPEITFISYFTVARNPLHLFHEGSSFKNREWQYHGDC